MEARELRIGNLVKVGEQIMFMTCITGKSHVDAQNFDSNYVCAYDIDMIDPIELTEEWLQRLGFKDSQPMQPPRSYFKEWIEVTNQFFADGNYRFNGLSRIKVELKYVHQLQNLYFALTGTELELSECNSTPKEEGAK